MKDNGKMAKKMDMVLKFGLKINMKAIEKIIKCTEKDFLL